MKEKPKIGEKEKKLIGRFVDGQKNLHLKIHEIYESIKDDPDMLDHYQAFLVALYKDDMPLYFKCKRLIAAEYIPPGKRSRKRK